MGYSKAQKQDEDAKAMDCCKARQQDDVNVMDPGIRY